MIAHRIETTLNQEGTLTLSGLPFHAGEAVEVIVLPRTPATPPRDAYPLRGKSIRYTNPFEPVAADDWAAHGPA
jgi:hypothetical protein